MPRIDPETGVPILGTRTLAEQIEDHVSTVMAEKLSLGPEDHDWVVKATYALSLDESDRAGEAELTGVAADPPIRLMTQTMKRTIGPICDRCEMLWVDVADKPCPGMTFEQYIASLDPDTREKVLNKLMSGDVPEGAVRIEDGDVVAVEPIKEGDAVSISVEGETRVVETASGAAVELTDLHLFDKEGLGASSPADKEEVDE